MTAYVIDTGIRTSHQDLAGRASVGTDTVGDGQARDDCHGHGYGGATGDVQLGWYRFV